MRLARQSLRTSSALSVIGLIALAVQSDGRALILPPPDGGATVGDLNESSIVVRPGSLLAWDQPEGPGAVGAGALGFWLVVDGEPQRLVNVTCGEPQLDDAPCDAPLPALEPGAHTLALLAVLGDDLEGPRAESDTFTVVVDDGADAPFGTALTTGLGDEPAEDRAFPTRPVIDGLDDAVDLALLSSHRALIAERSGRLQLVDLTTARTQVLPIPAPELLRGAGRGLLSVAVSADFAQSGLIYVLYSTSDGLELARFRLLDGTLGERAIIASGIPSRHEQPLAVVRQGPGARLYVAVDDAGSRDRAADAGDLAGKLLVLNPDGTTPRGQASPVLLGGLREPRALAIAGTSVWVLDGRDNRTTALRRSPTGAFDASSSVALAGRVVAAATLPVTDGGTDVVVLVASDDGLARVTLRGDGRPAGLERLGGAPSNLRALAVDSGGVLFTLTRSAVLRSAGPVR